MSSDYLRDRLLHAIIFFTKKTDYCYKTKLFKLLFLLDFGIYKQTGRSVTGLQYFAWEMGPVPRDLFEELFNPRPDLTSALSIRSTPETDPDFKDKRLKIRPREKFDESLFTKRELKMMYELAEVYRHARASQMIEVTHLKNQPWHQVYEVQKRIQAPIPYKLALDGTPGSITEELADLIALEEREARALSCPHLPSS